MDKLVLRESGFMDLVKNAAKKWAKSNAESLVSLEDRLKLVASGDNDVPVNVYIQVESAVSSVDLDSLPVYKAVACGAFNRLQEIYDMRPDGAPSHPKMPLLPEYDALMKVKELVGRWIEEYRTLKQFRYLVNVLPLDSVKQIDIFVPYGTTVPEESRRDFSNLRIMAQRFYAKILSKKHIDVMLPVVGIAPATNKPYTNSLNV